MKNKKFGEVTRFHKQKERKRAWKLDSQYQKLRVLGPLNWNNSDFAKFAAKLSDRCNMIIVPHVSIVPYGAPYDAMELPQTAFAERLINNPLIMHTCNISNINIELTKARGRSRIIPITLPAHGMYFLDGGIYNTFFEIFTIVDDITTSRTETSSYVQVMYDIFNLLNYSAKTVDEYLKGVNSLYISIIDSIIEWSFLPAPSLIDAIAKITIAIIRWVYTSAATFNTPKENTYGVPFTEYQKTQYMRVTAKIDQTRAIMNEVIRGRVSPGILLFNIGNVTNSDSHRSLLATAYQDEHNLCESFEFNDNKQLLSIVQKYADYALKVLPEEWLSASIPTVAEDPTDDSSDNDTRLSEESCEKAHQKIQDQNHHTDNNHGSPQDDTGNPKDTAVKELVINLDMCNVFRNLADIINIMAAGPEVIDNIWLEKNNLAEIKEFFELDAEVFIVVPAYEGRKLTPRVTNLLNAASKALSCDRMLSINLLYVNVGDTLPDENDRMIQIENDTTKRSSLILLRSTITMNTIGVMLRGIKMTNRYHVYAYIYAALSVGNTNVSKYVDNMIVAVSCAISETANNIAEPSYVDAVRAVIPQILQQLLLHAMASIHVITGSGIRNFSISAEANVACNRFVGCIETMMSTNEKLSEDAIHVNLTQAEEYMWRSSTEYKIAPSNSITDTLEPLIQKIRSWKDPENINPMPISGITMEGFTSEECAVIRHAIENDERLITVHITVDGDDHVLYPHNISIK